MGLEIKPEGSRAVSTLLPGSHHEVLRKDQNIYYTDDDNDDEFEKGKCLYKYMPRVVLWIFPTIKWQWPLGKLKDATWKIIHLK